MPRYYFHLRDGDVIREDLEGSLCEDLPHARDEAKAAAREILAAKLKADEVIDGQTFEIADEHGNVLEILPLRTVMRLE